MKSIKSICASICLILPLAVLGSQFTNGSFELSGNVSRNSDIPLRRGDNSLVGWTIGGSVGGITYVNGQYGDVNFPPPDGAYQITFNGGEQPSGTFISQTFDTLAGKVYGVTFFVGRLGGGSGDVSLTATVSSDTGVPLATFKAVPPSHGYGTKQGFAFIATSARTTLTIADTSLATISADVALDAVDVSVISPPASAPVASQNLLVNGDFAAGNTGFTSEYKFAQLDSGLLTYDIVKNPSQSHFLGASFGDHTSGTGLMFAANGANDINRVLWRQVVSVATNTAYQFSGWATPSVGPIDPDPSRISVRINGSPIRPGFQLSNPPGTWQNFSAVWNSGTSSVATIELRLETTQQGGNDLALDDLRFELTDQQRLLKIVPTPPGLVGWWPGDGNANDLAGSNNGILINASTRPGYVGQAFAFSGQNSY